MKKFLNNKKLIPSAVALLVILGFVNSLGAIGMTGGLAQVFSLTSFKDGNQPVTVTFGIADNGNPDGIVFKGKQVISVYACSAAGGGGGGGRGVEDGSDDGVGGGGGGGGGMSNCEQKKIRVSRGDVLHWLVGTGGNGGLPGVIHLRYIGSNAYPEEVYEDTVASNGEPGGTTYVSLNGIDIMQIAGGNGGNAGSNAYMIGGDFYTGDGGSNGSNDTNLQQEFFYAGGDGQWFLESNGWIGGGGWGGNGEGQPGMLGNGNGGDGGYSLLNGLWFGNIYGNHGESGGQGIGGGGGAGGDGKWNDFLCYLNGEEVPNNSGVDPNCIKNRGGYGGRGGDGLVQVTYIPY